VTGEARIVRGTVPITLESAYTLILPASDPPRGGHPLLLALHGYGDDGSRLRERLADLEPAPYALLLPDGPYPVEIRDQWPPRLGYAWYQYTGDQTAFVAALDRTSEHLAELLTTVARTQPIDPTRIAVLGYSQGGYLAGVMALKDHARYRGLVAIACRIKVEALTAVLPHARGFEVLVLHGVADESVKLEPQQLAIATLRQHGVAVDFQTHAGGHGLRRELVPRIDAFVRRVLGCPPRSA
jgi:predicted esterase